MTQRPLHSMRPPPSIRFAPLAWLKLLYFCHAGDTEIGGFAITPRDDPLYVEEFVTVRQQTSSMTVLLDDQAVADYMDRCVDQGLRLQNVMRIWIHTHPGASVEPSGVDEATFRRVFGTCDWGVMFILGRTGNTYARLSLHTGPGACVAIPTAVDWAAWPWLLADPTFSPANCFAQWREEFAANIRPFSDPVSSPDPLAMDLAYDPFGEMSTWSDLDQELWEDYERHERTRHEDRWP